MKYIPYILLLLIFTFPKEVQGQLNKFYIGMITTDFDNPKYYNCNKPEPNNTDKLGHDTAYLSSLKRENFNLIIAWMQYLKPSVQYVDLKKNSPDISFLDRAEKFGLSVIAVVPELYYDVSWEESPEWKIPYYYGTNKYYADKSRNAIAYYSRHKALIGWMLGEEPGTESWSVISALTQDIKKHGRGKYPYVNLLPIGAKSGQYMQGKTKEKGNATSRDDYKQYIQSYIEKVKPTMLSVDCYNPNILFSNLEIIRSEGIKNNIPFTWMITTGGTGAEYYAPGYCNQYRYTSYGECAFKIFSAMTYGAKGINYFAREGLLGNHTQYYSQYMMRSTYDGILLEMRQYMAGLHQLLTRKSDILMSLNIHNVYHKSFTSTYYPNVIDSIPDFQSWNYISGNNSVKSYFSNTTDPFVAVNDSLINTLVVSLGKDNMQQDYFWLFNKHLSRTIDIMPKLLAEVSLFNVFEDTNHSSLKSIRINPGEGKLFRIYKTKQAK